MDTTDPTTLTIRERLEKYPDSYTDDDLRSIMERYADRPKSGLWGRFPAMAFLILEKRHSDDYTKENK